MVRPVAAGAEGGAGTGIAGFGAARAIDVRVLPFAVCSVAAGSGWGAAGADGGGAMVRSESESVAGPVTRAAAGAASGWSAGCVIGNAAAVCGTGTSGGGAEAAGSAVVSVAAREDVAPAGAAGSPVVAVASSRAEAAESISFAAGGTEGATATAEADGKDSVDVSLDGAPVSGFAGLAGSLVPVATNEHGGTELSHNNACEPSSV